MNERLKFAIEQLHSYNETKEAIYVINSQTPSFVDVGKAVRIYPGVKFCQHGFGYEWYDNFYYPIMHMGKILIGVDVTIHENASIVRATKKGDYTTIGEGTKINTGVHIAHNAQIGKHCLIEANTVICGSVKIGDRCKISGLVYIYPKVTIGNDCQILPGSVVRKDLPDGTIYKNK